MEAMLPPQFRITIVPACGERIRTLADRATAIGKGVEFAQVLSDIRENLQSRPREWGDPNYRYHGLRGTSYLRLHERFRVIYLVDDQQPVVILCDVQPLFDLPLANG